jgi:hypothetical protein
MSIERRDMRLRHRARPLLQRWLLLGLLSLMASPAPSVGQGTAEQRQACIPDVFRLCSMFIPDSDQITACLKDKTAELSDACKLAISAGAKTPGRILNTAKRTTR